MLWRADEHEPLIERDWEPLHPPSLLVRETRSALGRGRYTLFTGDVGVALSLRACLDVDPDFPVLDAL
jgi:hypothetical protein